MPIVAGITEDEWERLPPRAKLLINAGFLDVEKVMEDWRAHWEKEKKGNHLTGKEGTTEHKK